MWEPGRPFQNIVYLFLCINCYRFLNVIVVVESTRPSTLIGFPVPALTTQPPHQMSLWAAGVFLGMLLSFASMRRRQKKKKTPHAVRRTSGQPVCGVRAEKASPAQPCTATPSAARWPRRSLEGVWGSSQTTLTILLPLCYSSCCHLCLHKNCACSLPSLSAAHSRGHTGDRRLLSDHLIAVMMLPCRHCSEDQSPPLIPFLMIRCTFLWNSRLHNLIRLILCCS